MLRLARVPALRPLSARSLVSSVLLTRTWENETASVLRDEAKRRGLSAKGNKATLVHRIQEHENRPSPPKSVSPAPQSSSPAPSSAAPPHARHASSTATPPPAAHKEGVAPGIPPAAESHAVPPAELLFQVNIPDLSQPDIQPEAQIPYVPDFWSSSTPQNTEPASDSPVMVVVGGEGTHLLSPTHNLQNDVIDSFPDTPAPPTSKPTPPGEGGIWDDIAEDIGLPPPKQIKASFWKLFS